jgi:4-amino-4-deoxy-L-arabinose transferase-like glycosyltransferase
MVDPRRRNRQLAVFLAGLLLLNFPVLGLIDAIHLPDGVPLTPLYLFAVWLGLILLSAAVAGRLERRR